LRNVKYRGKTVLYQAHVPILNVEYEKGNGCGPHYRDWQWQEYALQCDQGTDFPPGFRLCKSPAKTILDHPPTDGGNFPGVAVYVEGQEVVLKSQMVAGWYRYISEWRFHVNGRLRPRFGFGAVLKPPLNCVCNVHHHNVYWRFDFDIKSAGNNLVREYNNPPIFGNANYHDIVYEIRRRKNPHRKRHWEILNRKTKDTYGLFPGPNDGTRDSFGVGDLWVLKYHADQLDDGVPSYLDTYATSAAGTIATIGKFVDGEVVKDTDVVVWYGAHFKHDQGDEGASHVVGPDLIPLKWKPGEWME
jgi:hypothetical protein